MNPIRRDKTFHPCFQRFANTPLRCHLSGSAISLVLTLLVVAVHWWGEHPETRLRVGEQDISRDDARVLVNSAERWHTDRASAETNQKLIDEQIASIQSWLLVDLDWPSQQLSLTQAARATGIELTSIQVGDQYLGGTVGVLAVQCQLRGDHASLCRFLDRLATQENPIACNKLLWQIAEPGSSQASEQQDPNDPICQAELHLRLPFAATGSTAATLLAQES